MRQQNGQNNCGDLNGPCRTLIRITSELREGVRAQCGRIRYKTEHDKNRNNLLVAD